MFTRRSVLGALAATGVAVASISPAIAKKKRHQNGHAMLGDKLKKNGKHKLAKAGKVDVSVDVDKGKIVALTATDPAKGNLRVGKVKSKKKLADASDFLPTAGPGTQLAQGGGGYYGYWFDDGADDWYYWFAAEDVVVDDTWVEYVE
jgi:hypothetical protein